MGPLASGSSTHSGIVCITGLWPVNQYFTIHTVNSMLLRGQVTYNIT